MTEQRVPTQVPPHIPHHTTSRSRSRGVTATGPRPARASHTAPQYRAPADQARAAAEYVKLHGLAQDGHVGKPTTTAGARTQPVCLAEAVNRANPGVKTDYVRDQLHHFIRRNTGFAGMADWSDQPGRSKQDAHLLLLDFARSLTPTTHPTTAEAVASTINPEEVAA